MSHPCSNCGERYEPGVVHSCHGPKTIDTEHKDAPVCPHCGDEADGEEVFEDDVPQDGDERWSACSVCNEDFCTTIHLTITYSTRKP